MTMISYRADAIRRRPSGIINALLAGLAETAKRRRIRRDTKALSHLPPHVLRDMGLEQDAAPHDPAIPLRQR